MWFSLCQGGQQAAASVARLRHDEVPDEAEGRGTWFVVLEVGSAQQHVGCSRQPLVGTRSATAANSGGRDGTPPHGTARETEIGSSTYGSPHDGTTVAIAQAGISHFSAFGGEPLTIDANSTVFSNS